MPEDIHNILEDIRRSQHATELILASIQGEGKLQSQALSYHIDNLKDYKVSTDLRVDAIDSRLKKVETWQLRMAAMLGLIIAAFTLLFNDLKAVVFGK